MSETTTAHHSPTKRGTDRRKLQGRSMTRHVDVSKLDAFGFRLGSKKAKAASMYATKPGATLDEVKTAIGTPQYNVLTEMSDRGFSVEKTPVSGQSGKKVFRYHVTGVRKVG